MRHLTRVSVPVATGPRPDPARGVLETLAVVHRRVLRGQEHLARLSDSVRTLYDAKLPPDLPMRLRQAAAAARWPYARLRVSAVPTGGGVACDVEPAEEARNSVAVPRLAPVHLAGGLGEHKWTDRRLVETWSHDGCCPLFVELDGEVLEAGWANVWILEGDQLLTPPADGRLLPGVIRAAIPAALAGTPLEACEAPLTLDRIRQADAVFLTSSIRLVTVASTDGRQPHRRAVAIAEMLRAGLRGERR